MCAIKRGGNAVHQFQMTIKAPTPSRALIADDDHGITHLITTILKERRYEVVVANDGREAYRILQTDSRFRLAILDLNMPFLQGLDLVHYMRSERRLMQIPIMMITGENDLKMLSTSFAAGVTVFLPKPFTPEQLENAILLLIGNRPSMKRAS